MNKLMSVGNLEAIMNRLNGCRSLVNMLMEVAGTSTIPEAALSGISDLLEVICRDFQADIDCADDVTGTRKTA